MKQTVNTPNSKESKLFFSNISFNAEELDILELFGQHGKINDIQLLRDKFGRSLGTGYVEFEDPVSNQKAIDALNGKLYKDKIIHLKITKTNLGSDAFENIGPEFPIKFKNDINKLKGEFKNNDYYSISSLSDLPNLPPPLTLPPPPPPLFPMDSIPSNLTLQNPPFMISSEFGGMPSTNEPSKNYKKKKASTNNYSDTEYDYDSDYSDNYYSDYYYSDADDNQTKKNIPKMPPVLPPPSQYQMNPLPQKYEDDLTAYPLQPLRHPPPLPPLPPIPPPPNASAPPLLSNSSNSHINNYVPSRNAGFPLPPPPTLMNPPPLNEINIIPQAPAYEIQTEDNYGYGFRPPPSTISSSTLILPHEHHHHHRSRRTHIGEYPANVIDSMGNIHETDDQWMVMPPSKESLYWRTKRTQIIEDLKKAAYDEIRKASRDKSG